ncbi:MAG: YraN family protein [Treponema sp.]|nr:YraN family protein [Treponema sp.]
MNTEHTDRLSTKKVGDYGEDRACSYLKANDYAIIERNFRTRGGEIDIIASKDDVLVFVEVKSLPSGNAELLSQKIDLRKQKKIIKTAYFFLSKYRKYNNRKIRFDVIAIDVPDFPPVYHIIDAFSEFV